FERQKPVAPASRVHQPRRRVEKRSRHVAGKSNAAIDPRIPLRKSSLLQRVKRVTLKRIMINLDIGKEVDALEGRQILAEKSASRQDCYSRHYEVFGGPRSHSHHYVRGSLCQRARPGYCTGKLLLLE